MMNVCKLQFRTGSVSWVGRAAGFALLAVVLSACQQAGPTTVIRPDDSGGAEVQVRPPVIAEQHRQSAIEVVLASSRSDDSFLRSNSMESAGKLGVRMIPLLQAGLEDRSAVVRFAALVMVGREQVRELGPAAARALDEATRREAELVRSIRESGARWTELQRQERLRELSAIRSVRAAGLFAVYQTGGDVSLTPLGSYLASADPALRGNVAMLLGFLGDRSAVGLLEEAALRPLRMAGDHAGSLARVQVAEAVAKLGGEQGVDTLRAAMFSQSHETRVLAIEAIGNVGDRSMEGAMSEIVRERRQNLELRLAAGRALAIWGRSDAFELAIESAGNREPMFRLWSARILGLIDRDEGVATLVRLLEDSDPRVRLTAARAILEARHQLPELMLD